jgi:hypothetical protein
MQQVVTSMPLAKDHVRTLDTIRSLLRWRLKDPNWEPRFSAVMDDIRTCVAVDVGPDMVMVQLRDLALSEAELSERAGRLAEDATRHLTSNRKMPFPSRAASGALHVPGHKRLIRALADTLHRLTR